MTEQELQSRLDVVEFMLSVANPDDLTTIRALRHDLYFLQEQIGLWVEYDREMDMDLKLGAETRHA